MKLRLLAKWQRNDNQTLMTFGKARLVKRLTGKIELVGGSMEDRIAAKEWASFFLHEATI
jgi:hypothetical protein